MSKAPTAVKALRFYEARAALDKPLADATHIIPAIGFLIAEIELYNGRIGQGYLLCFHYSPHAIRGALRDMEHLAIGLECAAPGLLMQRAEREHEYFGGEGLQRWAVGVVNVALWDAWARTLDVPMHRLFGTHCERIAAYGSGGWARRRSGSTRTHARGQSGVDARSRGYVCSAIPRRQRTLAVRCLRTGSGALEPAFLVPRRAVAARQV